MEPGDLVRPKWGWGNPWTVFLVLEGRWELDDGKELVKVLYPTGKIGWKNIENLEIIN